MEYLIQVHEFGNEVDLLAAIETINAGEGLGKADQITQTYTNYYTSDSNTYYFLADAITRKYINTETTLTITVNDENYDNSED